ncbi:MAG TPA: hypothetical protein P5538_03800 [Bacteroidales bacterium]|nr:hypothetical protein [Bacteroidales bacterium]HOL98610.1 hypothetical protein [Bacteroidales bacterium]HOM36994.1 hypothetical protein [Bacteroidales bacterium]HPD24120.1 hypothetical protein [Bacteroidales bacterium]HRS99306.1 hypothetical protein [Bacteroidales bacterium]
MQNFFIRRKIIVSISIILVLISVLILIKYIYRLPENFIDGKAEFYKSECRECDSIVKSLKDNSKIEAILVWEDSLTIDDRAKLYGFRFELEGKYTFKAAYSNSLSVLNSNNFNVYPQYIITSVRDSVFLKYYFSFQTELLSKKNINGLILEIPKDLYSM